MQIILTVFQLFLSLGIIGLVLIQHGRGADAGAAFGSGASATVFGARGSGSFLSRATAILAALFFLTSMTLAYYAAQGAKREGLMDGVETPPPAKVEVPAAAPGVPIPAQGEGAGGVANPAGAVPPVKLEIPQGGNPEVPAIPMPQVAAPAGKNEAPASEARPMTGAPAASEKAAGEATETAAQPTGAAAAQDKGQSEKGRQ
jgi:preprotein translocase subunit SecG